jgi:hypothetical protein
MKRIVRLLDRRHIVRAGDERIHPDDWPEYNGNERWVPVDSDVIGQRYNPQSHVPIRRPNAAREGRR